MSEKPAEENGKGFNDSELADIMSEIETLEQDFAPGEAAEKAEAANDDPAAELQNIDQEALAKELAELDGGEEQASAEQAPAEQEHSALNEAVAMAEQAEQEESPAAEAAVDHEASDSVNESVLSESAAPAEEMVAAAEPESSTVEAVAEMKSQESAPAEELADSAPTETAKPVAEIQTPATQNAEVHSLKPALSPSSSAKSRMDFCVEGDMSLALNFSISGKQVKIHVDGSAGLVLEMDGGMKFTIPLDEASDKAA